LSSKLIVTLTDLRFKSLIFLTLWRDHLSIISHRLLNDEYLFMLFLGKCVIGYD